MGQPVGQHDARDVGKAVEDVRNHIGAQRRRAGRPDDGEPAAQALAVEEAEQRIDGDGDGRDKQAAGEREAQLGSNPEPARKDTEQEGGQRGAQSDQDPFALRQIGDLFRHDRDQQAAERQEHGAAVADMQDAEHSFQEIGAREVEDGHVSHLRPHPLGQDADGQHGHPDRHKLAQIVAAEVIDDGCHEIGPGDAAQNAERGVEDAAVGLAVGHGQEKQAETAEDFQAREEDGLPAGRILRIGVPNEEERSHGGQPVGSDAVQGEIGCQPGFRIAQEGAHDEQGENPEQDVSHGGFPAVALAVAVFNRVGDRHSHAEQEGRIDEVRQAHEIDAVFGVFHPLRHVVDFPEVVDEDHQRHRQRPEHIDGQVAALGVFVGHSVRTRR